ncbi:MAG: hypothetical protein BWY06_03439 [Candidatus Latescibacteria bacterium ADurb.Bin168]|nr:MAG: hypothetical protein BWY06_03439 [Candidatus Latescibacteria bacterium ADurb.Bin168]
MRQFFRCPAPRFQRGARNAKAYQAVTVFQAQVEVFPARVGVSVQHEPAHRLRSVRFSALRFHPLYFRYFPKHARPPFCLLLSTTPVHSVHTVNRVNTVNAVHSFPPPA